MSNYVFVVYRHAIATIVMAPFPVRNIRPKMTISIFVKLMLLAVLEPVIGQNLSFLGIKATIATFAVSMGNVLPAITFIMACILRLEEVNIKSSLTKVIGTITTVAGAMLMTLMKGPILELFWQKGRNNNNIQNNGAITLKSYPAELSPTVWICFLGTVEGTIVALVMERGKTAVWAIKWDTSILVTLYTGMVCSGLTTSKG